MIRETLQAPEGANTLAASGCLDLLNKILLALYFQDLKRVKKLKKRLYSCFHSIYSTSLNSIYVII